MTFDSIFCIGLISMLIISPGSCDLMTEFLTHFTEKCNIFDSVFPLALLQVEDRQRICEQFSGENRTLSTNKIHLVSVHPNYIEREITPVPAFECKKSKYIFYVSYSDNNKFFKLEKCRNQSSFVKIASMEIIHGYADRFKNIRDQVKDYFHSQDYRQESRRILSQFSTKKQYSKFCGIFHTNFQAQKQVDIDVIKARTILHGDLYENIPALPCVFDVGSSDNMRINHFYVALYIDNVFIKLTSTFKYYGLGMALYPAHIDNYDLVVL